MPLGLGDCWKEVTDNYTVICKIGEGSFGEVYKAKCKNTSKKVAIKHMNDFSDHSYGLVKVIRELKIMRKLGGMTTVFMPALIDVIIPKHEKRS